MVQRMNNRFALHSSRVVTLEEVAEKWIVIEGEKILEVLSSPPSCKIISCDDDVIMAGLVDAHVHINEPGRTEWEGFYTATQAAVAGGVTTVVDMPLNCDPVTTTSSNFERKLEALGDQLHVDIGFWGGVVPENQSELSSLVQRGVLGCKAFTCHSGIDDFPASDKATLRSAMQVLKSMGAPLLVHAELEHPLDLGGGGDPTTYESYLSSRPASWEVNAIQMVIDLVRETGCAAHIVHLSAAEALPLIAQAKDEGLPLTVETCPHYLCLTSEEIQRGQTQFKCAPPIRNAQNREALWDGLKRGIIDCIVSDHSPCTPELKKLEEGHFHDAWGGISSLQLSLPNIWTEAKTRGISLNKLTYWMSKKPSQIAGLGLYKGEIDAGYDADLVIWRPEGQFTLEPSALLFKHKLSPYLGRVLKGQVSHTYLRGQLVYEQGTVYPAQGRAIFGRN